MAGVGPSLVKNLQTDLAHAPMLEEKLPQENWKKNGCFLTFRQIER